MDFLIEAIQLITWKEIVMWVIGFVLIFVSIKFLPAIDNFILSKSRRLFVYVQMDSIENLGAIINYAKEKDYQLFDLDLDRASNGNMEYITAILSMYLPRGKAHAEVVASMSTLEGIFSIEEV